jgi:hypothetical protein
VAQQPAGPANEEVPRIRRSRSRWWSGLAAGHLTMDAPERPGSQKDIATAA